MTIGAIAEGWFMCNYHVVSIMLCNIQSWFFSNSQAINKAWVLKIVELIYATPISCRQSYKHFCFFSDRPTSKRRFLRIIQWSWNTIHLILHRNLCKLYIHLAFTYSVDPSSIVWSDLGPALSVTHFSMRSARSSMGTRGTLEWHPWLVASLVRWPKWS